MLSSLGSMVVAGLGAGLGNGFDQIDQIDQIWPDLAGLGNGVMGVMW